MQFMIKRDSARIKNYVIFQLFITFLFYRPASYVIGARLTKLFSWSFVVVLAFYCVLAFLLNRLSGYRPKAVTVLVWLLYTWCNVISSIIVSGNGHIDFTGAFFIFCETTCFFLYCDIGMWNSPKDLFRSIVIVGTAICTLNVITIFLFFGKGGMNPETKLYGLALTRNYFLLSEDNASYFWSWPTLVITWTYYYKYCRKIWMLLWALLFTAILIAGYVYVWSVLAAVACISVPVVLFFMNRSLYKEGSGRRKKRKRERSNSVRFTLCWLAGFSVQILFVLGIPIRYLAQFLTYLGKDITLSSRTYIWENSLRYIARSPIFGYGYEDGKFTTIKILINHTHHMLLETAYRGGAIGLALLGLVFLTLTMVQKKTTVKSPLLSFFFLMVGAFLAFSTVEFAYYRYHYTILLIILAFPRFFADRNPKVVS